MTALPKTKLTKSELARSLKVSRSSLYYKPKRDAVDMEVKCHIESALIDHPSYGHKRIALHLKLNKKRILRVMKKYSLKPYRRRVRPPIKKDDRNKKQAPFKNEIKNICPIRPNVIWVSDFTYIWFDGRFIYLATIVDRYTREVIGFNISRYHNKELVLGALKEAIKNTKMTPIYAHSDQGSEYDSNLYAEECQKRGIIISMSKKASPWENPHQESFYSQFKIDLGGTDQFETLGEFIESIYQTLYYYNNKRIHTALKMAPRNFREQYEQKQLTINRQAQPV